jgi:hypothetical protein
MVIVTGSLPGSGPLLTQASIKKALTGQEAAEAAEAKEYIAKVVNNLPTGLSNKVSATRNDYRVNFFVQRTCKTRSRCSPPSLVRHTELKT